MHHGVDLGRLPRSGDHGGISMIPLEVGRHRPEKSHGPEETRLRCALALGWRCGG